MTSAQAMSCACLCVIGLALTWAVAELVPATHARDAVALHDFTQLSRPRLDLIANALLSLLDPVRYILWGVVLLSVALARERPRVALAAALVMALAPLTSEVLKPLLAHSHAVYGSSEIVAASWPSGHSTAAMSLALCAVLVCPRHLRPVVAMVGTLFAIAVGFSLLVLAWHMPSDVFGGYLIAALWSSLAVAALCLAEERRPTPKLEAAREDLLSSRLAQALDDLLRGALVLGVLVGAIAIAIVLRTHHAEVFAVDHLSLVVAAGGIVMLAILISSTFAFVLRR